jgi:hypothetical protein
MMIRTDKRRGRTLGFRARGSAPPSAASERIKTESSDQSSDTSATSMDNSQTIDNSTTGEDSSSPQDWMRKRRHLEELEAFEKQRSHRAARNMELMQTQIAILQDLTAESNRETSAAYRFAIGISKAQQALASALVLPIEEEDNNDEPDNDPGSQANNQSMDFVSDLEEIPGKTNDETSASAAAVIDNGKRDNNNTAQDQTMTTKPMLGSLICFPNPAAKREVGFVVHHEQDALQQILARANITTESLADAQQTTRSTHEIVATNQIMTVLRQTETEIQKAWSKWISTTIVCVACLYFFWSSLIEN